MKKIISATTMVLFAAVLLFGAVACGGSGNGEKEAIKIMEKYTKKFQEMTKQVQGVAKAEDLVKFGASQMKVFMEMGKELDALAKKYPELKTSSKLKDSAAAQAMQKAAEDFKKALDSVKDKLK